MLFVGTRPWISAIGRCAALLVCAVSFCSAQTRRPPGQESHTIQAQPTAKAGSTKAPAPPAAPATVAPISLSNAAPLPATVSLQNGRLTVRASNSNLREILADIAKASGMTVSGLDQGGRVFGVYGPGDPRDVLTQILSGSGYNFMMVGDTSQGTPRELLLTAQTDSAPVAGSHPAAAPSESSEDPEDTPPPQFLGPGAIAHVPPGESPDADQDSQDRAQQHMQQLQQMRRQMEQQNQPQ